MFWRGQRKANPVGKLRPSSASASTVNWHVEQSKKKLDAVTRTQAVIKVLRSGEI